MLTAAFSDNSFSGIKPIDKSNNRKFLCRKYSCILKSFPELGLQD
jgi:hypothetical protein